MIIFFSALVIGSSRSAQNESNVAADGQMLVTTDLANRLAEPGNQFMSETEKADLAVGNMLLGPPGHVGRFSDLSEMLPMK